MAIPSMARTRDEFLAPFAAGGNFASLCVEEMEIYLGEDYFWTAFEQTADAQAYGAKWAAFSRASAFPSLAKNLDAAADGARSAAFFQQLEAAMARRVAARPERVLIPLCKMLLAKNVGEIPPRS